MVLRCSPLPPPPFQILAPTRDVVRRLARPRPRARFMMAFNEHPNMSEQTWELDAVPDRAPIKLKEPQPGELGTR